MGTPEEVPELEPGTAGASARRMYERRRANREALIRRRRFGALRLAVGAAPRHEVAWLRGAEGEEEVARRLAKHLRDSAHLLHDRRMPRSKANIDHIAVAASGVWVIDAKRWTGRVSVPKPRFGEAKLIVGRRDRSRLADGLARQVDAVRSVMAELGADLPVHGVFCCVEPGQLPALGTLTFRGYPLLSPRRLAGRIKKAGRAEPALLRAVAVHLSSRFPPA